MGEFRYDAELDIVRDNNLWEAAQPEGSESRRLDWHAACLWRCQVPVEPQGAAAHLGRGPVRRAYVALGRVGIGVMRAGRLLVPSCPW